MSFKTDILAAIKSRADRAAVAAVLARYQGSRVYLPVVHKERRRTVARGMLDAGMTRREIVAALQERFGISRRTAYRICQSLPEDGTRGVYAVGTHHTESST